MVRAKYNCQSAKPVTSTVWDKQHKSVLEGQGTVFSYSFYPVTGGSPENDSFFGSTPGGMLTLDSVREDLFAVGKSYYLDFTEAE